ncbi:hypothetical protein PDJAM_G00153570 [Pangasius djambal]|uniref:Uncharacterized protein n=1 Tax=Pangasius djambal TaxID=1691987 RepID=A0ACC5ZHS8_9TELE|nr:hypothetical protein [Pangasius djambal]
MLTVYKVTVGLVALLLGSSVRAEVECCLWESSWRGLIETSFVVPTNQRLLGTLQFKTIMGGTLIPAHLLAASGPSPVMDWSTCPTSLPATS